MSGVLSSYSCNAFERALALCPPSTVAHHRTCVQPEIYKILVCVTIYVWCISTPVYVKCVCVCVHGTLHVYVCNCMVFVCMCVCVCVCVCVYVCMCVRVLCISPVIPPPPPQGDQNFTRTFLCMYCYQLPAEKYCCNPNTSCLVGADP